MLPRQLSVRGRGLCGLVVLALSLPTAVSAGALRPEEILPPGEPRDLPIAAGETHVWRVTVAAGTALLVTAEQQSIDLGLEARRIEGGETITVHGGNDRWGPEVLLLEAAGEYRIAVRPLETLAWPGRYRIRTEALPAAASARRDALALMTRAGREAAPDTPEAQRRAVATYRQALAVWHSSGERLWEAETRVCLGVLEKGLSEGALAMEDFEAALALWRELGKPEREAEAWSSLGALYMNTETERARAALESALALWHGAQEPFDEAETRGNLCLFQLQRGSLSAALACFEENLAFFRGRGVKRQEAPILNNIGGVYDRLGEPDRALASYEPALALWRAAADRLDEAKTLNNIAYVHRTLGEWQEALRLYVEAREVLASLGERALEATLSNNIGSIYKDLGEPERALPYFEEALKLRGVGDRKGKVTSLNNLGSDWRQLGDLQRALGLHRQALDLAVELGDAGAEAVSRLRLAEVLLDQGEGSAALRELAAARALLREIDSHRTEAEVLHQEGRALTLAGRAREALPVLNETLALQRDLRDRAGEAETLYALALAERSLGLAADARSHAEAAVARVEELRIAFLAADLRASFLATRRRAFSLLIDLLMERHASDPGKGYDREAFAISERARARSLLDVLRAGRAGNAGNVAPPELLAQRSTLLRRLSAKVDQRWRQSGARAAALEREIDPLLVELDGVEAGIRRHDPRFAAFSSPQPVAPQEISGWLEPGTMLLEYSLGEERSFLWTIEAGELHSFVLPGQKEIEDLARRTYEEMSTVESGSARRGQAAEALSRLLLGPVWGERSAAARLRRLVVVPDGALGILPFAALPVPDPGRSWQVPGTRKPLLEHLEVVSIPSATTFAVQRQRLAGRTPAAKWAAVLADPVFTADDPRLTHRSAAYLQAPGKVKVAAAKSPLRGGGEGEPPGPWERLPATEKEAKGLAALAPAGEVWIALGLAANRDAVLSGALRDYRILHFATHAVADTQNPDASGLVLSQVNADGHPQEGFLGLSDIYELDLDADLVVLPGCQTAFGKEVRGEGLLGLTRGFQYAGVPRVVASLWRVEDRATAELMIRFYRAMWRDHLPPAAALRAAQRSLRSEPRYRDSYSWAGFVLQGDWQ